MKKRNEYETLLDKRMSAAIQTFGIQGVLQSIQRVDPYYDSSIIAWGDGGGKHCQVVGNPSSYNENNDVDGVSTSWVGLAMMLDSEGFHRASGDEREAAALLAELKTEGKP